MFSKSSRKLAIAALTILSVFFLVGAGHLWAFSVDVKNLHYSDDSDRSISYDFSAGLVGTEPPNAIPLDGFATITPGTGESGAFYFWGQAPGLPTINVTLDTTGNRATVSPVDVVNGGVAVLFADGATLPAATGTTSWFYTLELGNFNIDMTVQKAYQFEIGLGRDESEGPYNNASVSVVWVKGYYEGVMYSDNTLLIHAWVENGDTTLWDSTRIVRTGLDPTATTLAFDLSVDNGNHFFAAVDINSEGMQNLDVNGYTLTTGSFQRLPDLYPFVYMEEESASTAPQATAESVHSQVDGKYAAVFHVEDPFQQASAVRVTGEGNSYVGSGIDLIWDETNKFWNSGQTYEIGATQVTTPYPSFTFTFTPQPEGAAIDPVTKTITGYVTEFASELQPSGSVSTNPVFTWMGITGASNYGVELNDGLTRVWDKYQIPATLLDTYSVPYDGSTPLENGKTYNYLIWSQVEQNGVWNTSHADGSFTYTGTAAVDKGDINADSSVNMADAILALKVMSGMDSTGVSLSGDVNADGKIGMAEVIYILQYVAGLRTDAPVLGVGAKFPIATTTGGELAVSTAFDGMNYFVAIKGDASADDNVTAQLVSQTGSLVGPRISIGSSVDMEPQVAFDGTNYLLIWDDYSFNLNGRFISTSGDLIGDPFVISPTNGGWLDTGGIVFGGGKYLVVYDKAIDINAKDVVYCRLVDPSGSVSGEVSVSTGSGKVHSINQAAFDGTNFLIVWTEDVDDYEVRGRFVSPIGTLGTEFSINASTHPSDNPLAVAFDGTNYLVVWDDEVGGKGSGVWDLFGQLIDKSGNTVGGVISISTAAGHQIGPIIAFDGTDYLVSWTDMREDTNQDGLCDEGENTCWDIYGQYVSKAGALVGSEFVINNDAGNQLGGVGGFAGGKYFGLVNNITGFSGNDILGTDAYGVFVTP